MPTNEHTAQIIQSINPDEIEFQEYVNLQFSKPVQKSKPSKLYHCDCGWTIVTGQSKSISGTIYYGTNGEALKENRCPKCSRELPGMAKVS